MTMYQSKDELWLLSRGGRVAPVSRAGPRYRDRLAPPERDRVQVQASRDRLRAHALSPARLRRALGGGGRAEREPARAPSIGDYASSESYVELEFAVGFGVEDETWL